MENKIKLSLSIYGLISAISFIFLILIPDPGISISLFIILQFISIYLITKKREEVVNKSAIFMMLPIFILSLNRFISGNYLWFPTNVLATIILYSVMILMLSGNLTIKKLNIAHVFKIAANIFMPFMNFIIPLNWISLKNKNEAKNLLIKRIIIGVIVSIPCVIFLVLILSSADLIFYKNISSFIASISNLFNFTYLFKLIVGTFVGLYLFGHLYNVFSKEKNNHLLKPFDEINKIQIKGDVVISNILLFSILFVYTIFIAIQFKYLFAAGTLPYDLNYAEYARRGFFELVFLSVLNIALILATTYLLKDKIYTDKHKWAQITKFLMIYLCILTGIMLLSSFYRMMLYDNEYGFTRLRIIVYLFLIFEAIGLIATLVYIVKHNFNILAIYVVIALTYYLTLNVIQIDNIIAKRNINMYFAGQTESIDMNYLMSLSVDAAPEIMRLVSDDVDLATKYNAKIYLDEIKSSYNLENKDWRSYNLSVEKTLKLLRE